VEEAPRGLCGLNLAALCLELVFAGTQGLNTEDPVYLPVSLGTGEPLQVAHALL
jgi:hypothetical protein